tara:strand:+ start:679 stop:864 length:186 start_codon:yes stop_codon:yes gene_type:complete
MRDLTNYSDQELSLNVFNDEYFYVERPDRKFLLALINEEFYYTNEQMVVLMSDLADDDMEV